MPWRVLFSAFSLSSQDKRAGSQKTMTDQNISAWAQTRTHTLGDSQESCREMLEPGYLGAIVLAMLCSRWRAQKSDLMR